jgi:succinoglycan biosynthesis protein ExoA
VAAERQGSGAPVISIVCPVLNEETYIDALTARFLSDDGISKEIFFVDGGSSDRTRERVEALQRRHPQVFLVDNPKRYVSFGFNKAFPQTRGNYVAFLGAHADYPDLYFSHALRYLAADECDAIGGPLEQKGRTSTGEAIAWCMSHKFGVGGTEFRTSDKKQYVQSVAFAVYKREVLEEAGLLDEQLLRNQDDELHYRLNAHGYRILMVPEMKCSYYVRGTLRGLFRQYYEYGLFKPAVLKKVRSGIRLRHLAPSFFVLYCLTLPLGWFYPAWFIPLGLYLLLDISFSLSAPLSFGRRLKCMLVFPTLHVSYGAGFLLGLLRLRGLTTGDP